jgi:peptide/nickel transport system substrate-binding protein
MRKAIFFIFFLIFAQLPLEAQDTSGKAKPYGGTMVWGSCHKPTVINPFLSTYSISAALTEIIFSRLVRMNSKGEVDPDLAKSWDISDDGLVYTFYLRKGIKFHNGKECTARDVKFTYDNMMNPQNDSPFITSLELVESISVLDDYTLRITLSRPSAYFIYSLIGGIIPEHIHDNEDLARCSFGIHPVGSGPFKFKEWTKDNRIILEYNPDYYEGRPFLDRIIVKFYADSRELWTALMRQKIDFMLFLEKEDYDVVKNDPAFTTYAILIEGYHALVYNLDDPILKDKRVREAIAYAVDKKGLIERAAAGYGRECNGPFYPESLGFNPQVKAFDYQPQKAQELLARAGWKDKDNDGILEKDGRELEIRVLVDTRDEEFKRIAMVLRQQLQEVGIKIRAVLFDDGRTLENKEFLAQYKPQARLKSIYGLHVEPVAENWGSKESKRVHRLWTYHNEKVDRLIELGEATREEGKRKKIYQEMHRVIYADQPACFLYFPYIFHAVASKFGNTDDFFSLNMPLYTMKDCYLKETGGHR